MLGRTHAVSGALAWASVCSTAQMAGVTAAWPVLAVGLVSTAGAALLPDLDHPDATIAHSFGAASRALARAVNRVSGGHRHGTHSLAFAAALPIVLWLGLLGLGVWVALPVLFALAVFAARALRVRGSLTPLAGLALSSGAWFALRDDVGWLALSVAAGILAHLAGDCLTHEGCPLLWPHERRFRVAVIRRTGNRVERWLFAPVFTLGAAALIAFAR